MVTPFKLLLTTFIISVVTSIMYNVKGESKGENAAAPYAVVAAIGWTLFVADALVSVWYYIKF